MESPHARKGAFGLERAGQLFSPETQAIFFNWSVAGNVCG